MTMTVSPITPPRTALLLTGFQVPFLAGIADTARLLARAHAALSWARSENVSVVYARIAFSPADFAVVPTYHKAFGPAASGRFLADGSPESQIHESFDIQDADIVIRATRLSAFSATDLGASLRNQGITTLIIAGIPTGGAVLSTVRHAADKNYRLYVLRDATADPDPRSPPRPHGKAHSAPGRRHRRE